MSCERLPLTRRRLLHRMLVSGALLGLGGGMAACSSRALGEAGRGGRPAIGPSPDPDYYRVAGPPPRLLSSTEEGRDRQHVRSRLRIAPPIPPGLEGLPGAEDPIEMVHWRPRRHHGVRRGLILMSPVLANSGLLMDVFAGAFLREGWHGLLVFRKELTFDPRATLHRAEAESRLVVMRSVRAVDWALARHDVDPDKLGTFGISAGAIVSAMVAGADPRLRAHSWILGGGSLADVIRGTEEERYMRYREATRAATGWSDAQLLRRLEGSLRTDPLRLAERVSAEEVLMILARRDRSVPIESGWRLHEALGRPRVIETPLGHYSSFLLLPWMVQRSTAHFRRRFADTGS